MIGSVGGRSLFKTWEPLILKQQNRKREERVTKGK